MKYRILCNGEEFRIQYKWKWWPFWIYVKEQYGPFGGLGIRTWQTERDAKDAIDKDARIEAILKKPWLPLDSSPEAGEK